MKKTISGYISSEQKRLKNAIISYKPHDNQPLQYTVSGKAGYFNLATSARHPLTIACNGFDVITVSAISEKMDILLTRYLPEMQIFLHAEHESLFLIRSVNNTLTFYLCVTKSTSIRLPIGAYYVETTGTHSIRVFFYFDGKTSLNIHPHHPPHQKIPAKVIRWLTQQTSGLGRHRLIYHDLNIFHPIIEKAAVLGVGETTYGSHEFFIFRQSLFRLLVQHYNFRIFAMEISMANAHRINQFILSGTGSAKEALHHACQEHWVWKTQEILDLIHWMRQYNLRHPQDPVFFYGVDCQSTHDAYQRIFEFLTDYAPGQVAIFAEQCHLFNGVRDNFSHLSTEHKQQLYEQVINWHRKIKKIITRASLEILQDVQLLVQLSTAILEFAHNPYLIPVARKKAMADNIRWISRRHSGKKIFFWAHDAHVAKGSVSHGNPGSYTGTYLAAYFGDQYKSISLLFYQGKFWSEGEKGRQVFDIPCSAPGSLETAFARTKKKYGVFITVANDPDPRINAWLSQRKQCHSIGLKYNTQENFSAFSLENKLFDAIVFIRAVREATMLDT